VYSRVRELVESERLETYCILYVLSCLHLLQISPSLIIELTSRNDLNQVIPVVRKCETRKELQCVSDSWSPGDSPSRKLCLLIVRTGYHHSACVCILPQDKYTHIVQLLIRYQRHIILYCL